MNTPRGIPLKAFDITNPRRIHTPKAQGLISTLISKCRDIMLVLRKLAATTNPRSSSLCNNPSSPLRSLRPLREAFFSSSLTPARSGWG